MCRNVEMDNRNNLNLSDRLLCYSVIITTFKGAKNGYLSNLDDIQSNVV